MTAPKSIITRIFTVDLKTAEHFLSFEKQPEKGIKGTNRKFSDSVVASYAFEMLSGRWGFSHQGFAFLGYLEDGTADLRDGGQRCRALIQACTVGATLNGVTLPANPDFSFDVMVTEGLDEAAWLVMDIGKRRIPGDFLSSEGEVNTLTLSSTLNLCRAYENEPFGVPFSKERWSQTTMTPTVRSQYLESNPGIREAIYEGATVGRKMTVSSASAGYYLALKAGVDKALLDTFMDSLATGTGENWSKGNPVLTLREMLANARTSRRKLTREEQLALFIKSLNAFLAGQEIYSLSFKTKKTSVQRNGKTVPINAEAFPRFKV